MYSMTINGQRYEVTGGAKLTPDQYGALTRRKYESLLWEQEKMKEDLYHRITGGGSKEAGDVMDVDDEAEESESSASEAEDGKTSQTALAGRMGKLPKITSGAQKATVKTKAGGAIERVRTAATKARESFAIVAKRQTGGTDAKATRKAKADNKPSTKKRKAEVADRKEAAKGKRAQLDGLRTQRVQGLKNDGPSTTDPDALDWDQSSDDLQMGRDGRGDGRRDGRLVRQE